MPLLIRWKRRPGRASLEKLGCRTPPQLHAGGVGRQQQQCELASTLCTYDLRKGHLFVLGWARVRRVRRISVSSELLMCGGGVRSILLLPLVARCLEIIDVCIWLIFVFMSVVVTMWGSVGMFVVYRTLLNIVFFSLGVLKYVVCLCKGCNGCCIFCLCCETSMGSVSVSPCSCCMFVSRRHPVAVLNDAFSMTCSLVIRPYGRGILQNRSHDCLVGSHECLLLFTHLVAVSAFIICRGLCACTEMLLMCVLHFSFGFNVRLRTLVCASMGSAVLFIFWSRLLLYSSGFSVRLLCFVRAKTVCRYGCMYFLTSLVLVCVNVMVMSSE